LAVNCIGIIVILSPDKAYTTTTCTNWQPIGRNFSL